MPEKSAQKNIEISENGDFPDVQEAQNAIGITERSDRLRQAVRAAGGNQVVATRARMHVGTLNRYIGGRDMKAGAMIVLARACGVSLGWLATGKNDRESKQGSSGDNAMHVSSERMQDASEEDFSYIPRYDVKASAGTGKEVTDERMVGYVAFNTKWINTVLSRSNKNLYFIEASGDSMEPTISDGDYLLVDRRAKELQNGKIYALTVNDRLLVKRIQLRLDGSVLVKSDNKYYDPEILNAETVQNLHIVGQVVWHGGNVF